MHPLIRKVLAVLAGFAVGAVIISFIESYLPYQPPEGTTYTNGGWPYLNWVQNLPTDGWMIIIGALFCGTLVGGFVTHKITPPGKFPMSLITGFALLFIPIGKYMGFASPAWVTYVACLGSFALAWIGGWLAHLNYSAKPKTS